MEISRSLRAFTGEEDTNGIKGLWLCGGSSLVPGLTDYLSEKLDLEVNSLNPMHGINVPSLDDKQQIGFSVALGLGIIGIDGEKRASTVNANLLPGEIKERGEKARHKFKMIFAAAAAILILAGAGIGFSIWRSHKNAQYQEANNELAKLQRKEKVKAAKTALENSIIMQKAIVPYITPLEVLREMSSKLPDRKKVALTNFNVDKKGKITMGVEAKTHADISEMIQILSELEFLGKAKLFDEVKHGTISKITKDKSPVLQVQIACLINSNAIQENN